MYLCCPRNRCRCPAGFTASIPAKADGIVSINGELTEGKSVKAGQTLFSIESGGLAEGNLDVRYQEAENNYLLAKAEYERKQSLAANTALLNNFEIVATIVMAVGCWLAGT